MPRRGTMWLLAILLIVTLSICRADDKDELYQQSREMAIIIRTVRQNYDREIPVEDLFGAAFRGMADSLDPYSQYLHGEKLKTFQSDTMGEFGGLGIEITVQDGILTVVTPLAGTPAWDAGILPGDRVLKIDSVSTERLRLEEAVRILRGKPGSDVVLTVRHRGSSIDRDIKITRAVVKPASLEMHTVCESPRIVHVRIYSFTETMLDEFDAALKRAKEEKAQAVILDLRDNPGGLLRGAVGLADRFLSEGVIVSVRGRHDDKTWRASKTETTWTGLMAVMVNSGSASASEIVAAAIKENHRGLIVGEPTFGKGSVQTVFPLDPEGNSALKLTTAHYYTPDNHRIDREHSVIPDVEVRMSMDELLGLRLQEREDKMRGNGAENSKPKDETTAAPSGEKEPEPSAAGKKGLERRRRVEDIQLTSAVSILRAQSGILAAAAK